MEIQFTLLVLFGYFTAVELVLVDVEQGTLRGEILTGITGTPYTSFKGIPYAAPPVDNLRFKAPQPPIAWDGIRNATEHGSICLQDDTSAKLEIGSEDCLYINVYTPTINPPDLQPVMVFIHGGAFEVGSGNTDYYSPDFLIEHNVVVVTMNYRLGPFGFLCLDTEEVPGNTGLKDQVAALRWVNRNIGNFGGDPNLVTIFGQSAGGASVAYHLLSPMSKGLFKRAISMSGVPICDFAQPFRPVQKAFILGKQLGIDTNDTSVLLNYLQKIPTSKFYNVDCSVLISEKLLNNDFKMYNFVPVVEKNFGIGGFLTENPLNLLKKGCVNEVDMIFGYTSEEMLVFINQIVRVIMSDYERYPEMVVPIKMLLKFGPEINLAVSDKIRQHYFSNQTIDERILKKIVTYANEVTLIYDINRFIAMLPKTRNNTRYLYKFSAVSGRNVYGNQGRPYNITGAAHQDDLMYLFDAKSLNIPFDENSTEYYLIQKVCGLYTNFAKYGNPTPNRETGAVIWPQYDNINKRYLDIGTFVAGKNPDAQATTFWKSMFDFVGLRFYV